MSVREDWKETSRGWRIALAIITAFVGQRFAWFSLRAFSEGDALTGMTTAGFGLSIMLFWIYWPFRIAVAARKKGRGFTGWMLSAMWFSPLLVGTAYWIIVKHDLDVEVPEQASESE